MKIPESPEQLSWSDFEPSDATLWTKQALKEIKEGNTLESLTWLSEEGIRWQSIYHPDKSDVKRQWIQTAQKQRQWTEPIAMFRLTWHDHVIAEIKEALDRGIKGIQLCMPNELPQALQIQKSLLSFPFREIPIYWMSDQPETLYQRLKSFYPYPLLGGIPGLKSDSEGDSWCRTWTSGVSLAASGANAVHELAFILYSWQATAGIAALEYSLQTNFFLDIAKGRALRYLAYRFAQQEQVAMPLIFASFNPYYLTRQASTTNQLRCTTAALAAIAGGVDGYWVPTWNANQRIALNIPLIVDQEGYADQVIDPSQGSYFIEALTQELIEAVAQYLDTLPEEIPSADWQKIASSDHEDRLARKPTLVGATHFRSPETLAPPFSIRQWPPIFTEQSLELSLLPELFTS